MDAFNPHQMTLTPHQPMRFKDCRSIAYMTGDLPSVILHIGGDKYELFPGQCIPTGGTIVMIENPYERHGLCEFSLNGKPQPMADMRALPGSRQAEYVTYITSATISAPVATADMGLVLHLKGGRGRVKLQGSHLTDGYILQGLPPNELGNRPASMTQQVVQKPQHSGGAVFPRAGVRAGEIPDSGTINTWLSAYGLTWGNWNNGTWVTPDAGGSITVDLANDAMIAVWGSMDPGDPDARISITLEDFGVREGKAHA